MIGWPGKKKQTLEAKDSQSGVKHIISNGWIK
jgi:hypothetical protein